MSAPNNGREIVGEHEKTMYRFIVSDFPSTWITADSTDGATYGAWIGEEVSRIVGYDVEELESDPNLWLSVIHPADKERVTKAMRALTTGMPMREEYRIFRRNGQLRWVLDIGIASIDLSRNLIRIIRCISDVTSHETAIEPLISFRQMVDEVPNAVTVRDLSGRLVYCNEAARKLYGFDTIEQMIGTQFEDVIAPGFMQEFENEILPRKVSGAWFGEVDVKRRDGAVVTVNAASNVFQDKDGNPTLIYTILTDLTDRKQAEEALRESKDLLRATQDSIPALIAVLDNDGNIIDVNEAWVRSARENGDPDLSHTGVGVNYLDVCRRVKGPKSEGAKEALEGLQSILNGTIDFFEHEYPCPAPGIHRTFQMRASRMRGGRGGAVVTHIETTQRKQIEEELRESEERFRALVERIDDWVWAVDENLVYTYSSPISREMFGYEPDEIVGKTPFDLMSAQEAARIAGIISPMLERKQPITMLQNTMLRKDGHEVIVETNGAPVFDKDGIFRGYRGVDRDITSKKHAEEKLRESEELYHRRYEAISVGLLVHDPEGRIVQVNKTACEIIALPLEQLLGRTSMDPMWQILREDGSPFPREELPPLVTLRTKAPTREVVLGVLCNDPHRCRWLLVNSEPIFDPGTGELREVLSTLTDITEQKNAASAVKESEEKLRALVENVDALIFRMAPNFRAIQIVGSPERTIGYTSEELIENPELWPGGIVAEDRPYIRERELEAAATGNPISVEFRVVSASGAIRWLRALIRPRYDENGRFIFYDGLSVDITERVRAEQAIRESEAKYRSLIENVDALIYRESADGRPIALAGQIEKMTGYTVDEIMANPSLWHAVIYPEDRGLVHAKMPEMVATRAPVSLEFRIISSKGKVRWIRNHVTPRFDDKGNLVDFDGVALDITDSKEIEQALQQSEAKYKSLVENLNAVVFRMRRDMTLLELAGQVEKILGYSREEILENPSLWYDVLYPDDRDVAWGFIAKAEATRSSVPVELRICRPTGEVRWVRGQLTPLFDSSGDLLYFDGVTLDITDQQKIEEALQQSEAKYRSLVDNLDAVVFKVNAKHKLVALAGRIYEKFGYTIDEMLDNPSLWTSIMHPDDRELVRTMYAEAALTGKPQVIEMRIILKSGEVAWTRTHITPRYDDNENLVSIDGVGVDITERVEAQEREARHTARIRALTEISQELSSSLDFHKIIDIATRRISETLGCIGAATKIDRETGRVIQIAIYSPREREASRLRVSVEKMDLTIETAFGAGGIKPRVVSDIGAVSPVTRKLADKEGLGPGIMAPVYAGDELLCILLAVGTKERKFDDEDLWFVTEVASHVSTALVSARLYERQATIAGTLQRSLIPETPQLDCLDVATLYAPASGEAAVGGDFLDVMHSDCDRVEIIVGDVSGKGLEAAIHTAETKYMLRGFLHQNSDPAYVINTLNNALCEYTALETFVTLAYIIINTRDHTIQYVNAGHEIPLVLCRDDHIVKELKPCGPMLGVVPDYQYSVGQMILEPDDSLICYTDGITDVRGNGERFGYERLVETVLSAPYTNSKLLMDYVMIAVHSFGLAKQTDDQVMVVARIKI